MGINWDSFVLKIYAKYFLLHWMSEFSNTLSFYSSAIVKNLKQRNIHGPRKMHWKIIFNSSATEKTEKSNSKRALFCPVALVVGFVFIRDECRNLKTGDTYTLETVRNWIRATFRTKADVKKCSDKYMRSTKIIKSLSIDKTVSNDWGREFYLQKCNKDFNIAIFTVLSTLIDKTIRNRKMIPSFAGNVKKSQKSFKAVQIKIKKSARPVS